MGQPEPLPSSMLLVVAPAYMSHLYQALGIQAHVLIDVTWGQGHIKHTQAIKGTATGFSLCFTLPFDDLHQDLQAPQLIAQFQ